MSRLASIRRAFIGLVIAAAAAAPALAQTVTYSGSVNGISAGTLQYSARESGGQYATSFLLQTSGLAGLFSSLRLSGEASGRMSGANFQPGVYRENSANGDDRDRKEIRWSGNTPRVVTNTMRQRAYHASAGSAAGHVDPATALHILFKDRTSADLCRFDYRMFDGARRMRIFANGTSGSGNTVRCNGTYRRVAGYSNNEMGKGQSFPFTLTYRAVGGDYQLQSFEVRAVRGRLRFTRR